MVTELNPRVGRELSIFPMLPVPPKKEEDVFVWLTKSLLPALDKELRYLRRVVNTLLEGAEQTSIDMGTSEEGFTPP